MLMGNEDLKMQVLRDVQRREGGVIVGNQLLPLRDHLSGVVDDEVGPYCSIGGHWYVLQADARQDRTAVETVAKAGFPVYRPIVIKDHIWRGRKVRDERSMFGMYFFVRCLLTEANYHKVRLARGVRRFLDMGDGRPLAVPNWAMDIVRLKESECGTPVGKGRFLYHFSPGDQVRIKNGPFASFFAKLETAVDEHGRIKALVEIFSRPTPIEFDADQLEAT